MHCLKMLERFVFSAAAVFVFCLFTGCSARQEKPQEFVSTQYHVAFMPPAGFIRAGQTADMVAVFREPKEDDYAPIIEVYTMPVPERGATGSALPEAEKALLQWHRSYTEDTFLESARLSVAGREACRYEFRRHPYSPDPSEAKIVLHVRLISVACHNQVYLFSFTARDTEFDSASPIFDKVVRSIRCLD